MTNCVRITVHHQERILSARDHQMRGVIACLRRRGEKVAVARFFLEILHPPRRPKRFQFFLRKFFCHFACILYGYWRKMRCKIAIAGVVAPGPTLYSFLPGIESQIELPDWNMRTS